MSSSAVSSASPVSLDMDKPRVRCTKICRKCGIAGHVEKWCYSTAGGTVYVGDLPPSTSEEQVRVIVEQFGQFENMRFGTNYDGGKWAILNMVDKEGGENVIKGLHMTEMKGREIVVKWKEEGMWTCADPTCRKSNFDERDACVQCRLPLKKMKVAS
eukprot:GFUD01120310.1.p1 GENE.GFUD01120310.1~~GFUD01120310.1.p1  ORF type:complete len:157 (+),score=53.31 GFUD01120310.1:57-527(+)